MYLYKKLAYETICCFEWRRTDFPRSRDLFESRPMERLTCCALIAGFFAFKYYVSI